MNIAILCTCPPCLAVCAVVRFIGWVQTEIPYSEGSLNLAVTDSAESVDSKKSSPANGSSSSEAGDASSILACMEARSIKLFAALAYATGVP